MEGRDLIADDYYIRKADVEKLIETKIEMLRSAIAPGKGLKNSIVNLNALKKELDNLYAVKVAFKSEPTIFRKGKTELR